MTEEATRYLRVSFGDNDFGIPVSDALQRVWLWVNENNSHLLEGRTVADLFELLHKQGALSVLLERAIDAEYHYRDVEFATRSLYTIDFPDSLPINWENHVVKKEFRSITDEYLTIDLSFHDDKKFAQEWANGEEAALDLQTGEVTTH